MLYIPARLRMHACMQFIRAPPTLICIPIRLIWQTQNGDLHELTVLRRLQTNAGYVFSGRDPYGAAIL